MNIDPAWILGIALAVALVLLVVLQSANAELTRELRHERSRRRASVTR